MIDENNSYTYIICPVCNLKLTMLTTQHINKHGYLTAKEFKEKYKIDYLKSQEMRDKQSNFMSKNNNSIGGRSEATKKKISQNRTGKGIGISGKYKRTSAIREKISKSVAKRHIEGAYRQNKYGCKGYIFSSKMNKAFYYASSWEKRLIEIFDTSPRINKFYYENFEIPYYYDGSMRIFIPDFFVVYDEVIEGIFEVKRQDMIDYDPKTDAKIMALQEFCGQKGYNCFLVTLETICDMEKFLKTLTAEELEDYDLYIKKSNNTNT